MILDSLKNSHLYNNLHIHFKKAFEYLSSTDLENLPDGKFDIDGENIRAIVSNKKGVSADESCAKFECHNRHIDIQVCVNGKETMGWKNRLDCVIENGGFNDEKDVQLYLDKPDTFLNLSNNQFVIFFPTDVHAPMIGEDYIKKIVLKIKI